jgi:hypothetical protein
VRANKTAFPPSIAFPPRIPHGAHTTKGREILALVFFQIGAQVVLEAALVAESAFSRGELRRKYSAGAESLLILVPSKSSIRILASDLWLLLLVVFALLMMRRFGGIVCIFLWRRYGNGVDIDKVSSERYWLATSTRDLSHCTYSALMGATPFLRGGLSPLSVKGSSSFAFFKGGSPALSVT